MKRTILAAALFCVTAFGGSDVRAQAPAAPDPNAVVATINGTPLTAGEVETFYNSLPPQYRQIPLATIYDQLVERLIDQKLLAAAARKAGYADRPEVQQRVRMMTDGLLNQLFMQDRIASEVSEEKLREEYQKAVALEPKRDEVRARHILVKTRDEAVAIIAEIRGGADFAEVAKKKSTGPSGRQGGDLGYFTAGQMVPPFSEAAFALKIGEVTQEPVQTQFGWHVILVEDRRVSGNRTFEEVSGGLRQKMTEAVFDKTIQELRAKAKVERKDNGAGKIQPVR